MTTLTLPWFPPAPAPAPISILDLPPDDWALEPKIDGIRVIWLAGRVYTRHGALLSLTKGAERLSRLLVGIDETLDGEWVPGQDTYVVFDLPDCPLDYDGRRSELVRVLRAGTEIETSPNLRRSVASPETETCPNSALNTDLSCLSFATNLVHVHAVASYTSGHFPSLYQRLKRSGAEGIVLKRRRSLYAKELCSRMKSRVWLKRRFGWD